MTKSPKRPGKQVKAAKKARPPKAAAIAPEKLLASKKYVAPKKNVGPSKNAAKKGAVRKARTRPPADLSRATAAVLDRLFEVVTSRRDADPTISHSARLLSRGTAKVAQKFGEEAVECLIEAVSGNSGKLVGESADVLYHLIVLWVDAGLQPDAVWSELQRRQGTSGIAEKASRRPLGAPVAVVVSEEQER